MALKSLPDALRCDRACALLAAATVVLHGLTARGYGIFRDELYYLACSQHLDWGYVDHPPLVAVGVWFVRHLLGTSLFALRLLPALAAGILVFLGGAIARQFGGGRFAQLLSGIAIALAPQYLGMLSIYSMNAFDLLVWTAITLAIVHIIKSEDRRGWLLVGVLVGLGLQNKLSVAFLCVGLAVGLLLTPQRRQLRDRHLWLGILVATVLFAPHIIWQMVHDWPTVDFVRSATETKNIAYAPVDFILAQVEMMNRVSLPLWLLGLGALLLAKDLRSYRFLAWTYAVVLLLMLTRNAKPYYLSPIYPPLYAAGAVIVERATRGRAWIWIRPTAMVLLLLSGAALAPLAKPILSEDRYVRYAARLGVEAGTDERHEVGRLPQFYADMHGWEDLVKAVARVHQSLAAEERNRACVFAQNYGQAGAIDFFGPALGLPRAMSGHNSYWMWGPGECDGQVVIMIGGNREDHLQAYEEVSVGGEFVCRDCMPYENNLTLWVARRLRAPIEQVWPRVRHFE